MGEVRAPTLTVFLQAGSPWQAVAFISAGAVAGTMFPFERRWQWFARNRYAHLFTAIHGHLEDFHEPYRSVLRDRARKMRVAMPVRTALVFLLNIGILATTAAGVLNVLGLLEPFQPLLTSIARASAGTSLAFLALVLLATRYLGQLEADMVAAMALGAPGNPVPDDTVRSKVIGLEGDA